MSARICISRVSLFCIFVETGAAAKALVTVQVARASPRTQSRAATRQCSITLKIREQSRAQCGGLSPRRCLCLAGLAHRPRRRRPLPSLKTPNHRRRLAELSLRLLSLARTVFASPTHRSPKEVREKKKTGAFCGRRDILLTRWWLAPPAPLTLQPLSLKLCTFYFTQNYFPLFLPFCFRRVSARCIIMFLQGRYVCFGQPYRS